MQYYNYMQHYNYIYMYTYQVYHMHVHVYTIVVTHKLQYVNQPRCCSTPLRLYIL